MGTKRMYSVTVIPDNEEKKFSPSMCTCSQCKLMHMAQLEWDTFTPNTNLQKNMKKVISNIEKNIKNDYYNTQTTLPKYIKQKIQ